MAKGSFIDWYCRKVRKVLICKSEIKDQILNNLQCDLAEYVENNPEATDSQLIEKFGNPESYAKAYLATLSDDEILVRVKTGSFRKKLWIILAAVMVVAVVASIVGMIIHNNQHMGRYYTEAVSTITTDNPA